MTDSEVKWRIREWLETVQLGETYSFAKVLPGVKAEVVKRLLPEILAGLGRAWQLDIEQAQFTIKFQIQPFAEVLKSAFEQLTTAAENGKRLTGVSTGYHRIDWKISGLHPGDLIVVAARPGMGKTAFATNVAVNVASPRVITAPGNMSPDDEKEVERHEPGEGVILFSLGMPRDQLSMRMVCAEGRVNLSAMTRGFLQPDDWRRLTEAASYLSSLPIWVDDTPSLTAAEIGARVRRLQSEYNKPATESASEKKIGLVVVDYLQLCKGKEGAQNREEEISDISRVLKEVAMSCRVPIIAISQLNRAVDTRQSGDRRPRLSDLRGSGCIEDDADTLIFIYREDYYRPGSDRGIAEVIIEKQRNGPLGKVLLRYSDTCLRFDNIPDKEYEELEDEFY